MATRTRNVVGEFSAVSLVTCALRADAGIRLEMLDLLERQLLSVQQGREQKIRFVSIWISDVDVGACRAVRGPNWGMEAAPRVPLDLDLWLSVGRDAQW